MWWPKYLSVSAPSPPLTADHLTRSHIGQVVSTPLHTRIPLGCIERDVWLNLTFGARRAWRAEWRVGAARYRVGVGSGCDGVLTAHS